MSGVPVRLGALARAGVAVVERQRRWRRTVRRTGRRWRGRASAVATRISVLPVVGVITALGWTVVASVGLLGLTGWLLGWLEFRALAVLALLLLVLAVPFALTGSRPSATLRLETPRVRVGEPGRGLVVLRSPGGRRITGQRIELPVGSMVASFAIPSIQGDDAYEQEFEIGTSRRGVIPLGPVAAIRADPIGLLRRRSVLSEQQDLFVHPRVVLVGSSALGFLRDIEGVTTKNLSSSDVTFHGLRDYAPGDDRRAVHWRSSARTDKLVVRQFAETKRAHLLVLLSTRVEDYGSEDDFELAVSVAASIAVTAMRQDRRVSIATSTRQLNPVDPARLLDEFCRVGPEEEAEPVSVALDQAMRAVPGASIVTLVTGPQVSATEFGTAQLKLSPDIMCFGVRAGAALSLARRRAGKISVLDVSALDELNRGLQAIA